MTRYGAAVLGVAITLALIGTVRTTADNAGSLRITSPLGRTGLPGAIRIVARLEGVQVSASPRVDFYVDQQLLASDSDGPPYDAQWSDENPFEKRELTVRAEFGSGMSLTDTMILEPLELTEASEITSVLVEVSVLDDKGRFIKDLAASDFELKEDAQVQKLDLTSERRDPALFTLLVDSSQSMAMRADAVRATATKLLEPLAKDDEIVVAPFSRSILSITGPTTDRATVLDAIAAIRPAGGTAILDALGEAADKLAAAERRRAIVLITDGYDEHSESAFDATVAKLRKSAVTVYV
ncbi:MAG TPA: VWA domain-containing protein, partial [Vicinamibacterales bacterium]